MTRNSRIKLLGLYVLFMSSCASIPPEAYTLQQSLTSEGTKMHTLNISLLSEMFQQKFDAIDDFLMNQYMPQVIDNFCEDQAGNCDDSLHVVLVELFSIVDEMRNDLKAPLAKQQQVITEKLNENYKLYLESSMLLGNLIMSASKVNEERRAAFQKLNEISKSSLDLNKIELQLNKYIDDASRLATKAQDFDDVINELDSKVKALISLTNE
jgi:hypothetical protein